MSDYENPNPSLWRCGETTINLARVVATAIFHDHMTNGDVFGVLFDVSYGNYRTIGRVGISELFVPMHHLTDDQRDDFLRALTAYHSKF